MDEFDCWHALEEFSVDEAALLIAEVTPGTPMGPLKKSGDKRYTRYYSARKLLIECVHSSNLRKKICYSTQEYDSMWASPVNRDKGSPDWSKTKLAKDEIREILKDKGIHSEFFSISGLPGYLDPKNLHYAPKLAAAVNAWIEVDRKIKDGENSKSELKKWLKDNAENYKGLTDKNGKPILSTIEACARIANWNPKGGAPKTPVK